MVNSFFLRVALFHFFGISLYIAGLLIWIYVYSIPAIDKAFDSQQEAIITGLAEITDTLDESKYDLSIFFQSVEKILVDTNNIAMQASGNDFVYNPLISIHDKGGNIIYASAQHSFLDRLPLHDKKRVKEIDGKEWHIFSHQSDHTGYYLTIAESKDSRQALIGNPFIFIMKFFLFMLLIIGLITIISAYYALKPLRQTAKYIASRKLSDFNLLDTQSYYTEIRPIITEINQLVTKLQSANLREKQFLADAAHELRTPVAAIQTQLYLLTNLQNINEKDDVVKDMLTTISRFSTLSTQLINIARIESEDMILKKETICLNVSIKQCVNFYMKSASTKQIKIRFNATDKIIIYNDRQAFYTVISNLLDNAVKYTQPGGNIDIYLSPGKLQDCRVIIRDDGPGISEEFHTMIFERFYRIPENSVPGSGLGLAIVKNLIYKLGGQLEIGDGLNGKGVGFIITIPAIRNDISAC
jgi:two-component system sensor histidine kinase QseC